MLKKLLPVLIFSICLLCCFSSMQVVYALSTPHIIIEGEVWLLDKNKGSRLFLLPDTYYAKIDNMDDNFYYITFNGVSGKVEKTLVSTVGYHTQAAGTMKEIKIHPQFNDFVSIALKSSMDASAEDIILPVDESFIFLGEYPLSEMWYCVRYNESIGYIKASRTTIPEMVIPAFVPETIQGGSPPAVEKPEKESFIKDPAFLRIIIIIGLSIPAVILIFLLFKPQKPKRQRYYYEE